MRNTRKPRKTQVKRQEYKDQVGKLEEFSSVVFTFCKKISKRCPCCRKKVHSLQTLPDGWEKTNTHPENNSLKGCSNCRKIIQNQIKVSIVTMFSPLDFDIIDFCYDI